jgi:hypothetical protein
MFSDEIEVKSFLMVIREEIGLDRAVVKITVGNDPVVKNNPVCA